LPARTRRRSSLADVVERQKTKLAELEELSLLLRQMKRAMFGRRSERLDPDQMQLALEDLEADIARAEEKIAPAAPEPAAEPEAPARGRDLPDHLPHRDLTIEPADVGPGRAACPCCGGALHAAGETVSKMLDYVPAQIRVLRIRRPKYACRGCGTLHQAPASDKAIAKGMATPALLAHVIVSRYGDHVPFHRQSQILARHGVEIDRSVLAGWAGLLVARGAARRTGPGGVRLDQAVRGRHADADAQPRGRAGEDRPVLGLRPGRPALAGTRSAGGGLLLHAGPQGRTAGKPPGRLPGRVSKAHR